MTAATTEAVVEAEPEYVPVQIGEILTPAQIESYLSAIFNAMAKNQLVLMRLRSDELDAKLAYERIHVITTMDPMCPQVERGGTTVAEREDWIRGVEFNEYSDYEQAKKRVRNCRDYLEAIKEQASILQSLNRNVVATYTSGGRYNGQGG